ncbi:MAG: NAD-dependent epimerase/dehydratase family protein [Syntrophorhabdus sp.]|nr:NAD-dependent epimerase/dehydratase family protein [Syntrophorhabdus sp.]
MNVLITGAAGYIGNNLVAALCRAQEKVNIYAVDNFFSTSRRSFEQPIGKQGSGNSCVFFEFDFYDLENMVPLLEVMDVVVHLAEEKERKVYSERSTTTRPQVIRWQKNVEGYRRLLEASVICGVKRVVLGSWSGVYVESPGSRLSENEPIVPINQYYHQKISQEYYSKMFAYEYMLDTVTLRMSNVYGVGPASGRWKVDNEPGVISVMVEDALMKGSIEVHNKGEQKRNFVFVGDVVEALRKAIFYTGKLSGNTFNICSDKTTRIIDVAEMIAGICDVQIQHRDVKWQKNIVQHSISNTRAKKVFGYRPTDDMPARLEDMVETVRSSKDMI